MKRITTFEALVDAVVSSPIPVYIRYSRGPRSDRAIGTSTNHQTGRAEDGLSVNPLTPPEWWQRGHAEYIRMNAPEYVYLLIGQSRGYPWLLTGEEVGRGSDNEPLVANWKPLARVDISVIHALLEDR